MRTFSLPEADNLENIWNPHCIAISYSRPIS